MENGKEHPKNNNFFLSSAQMKRVRQKFLLSVVHYLFRALSGSPIVSTAVAISDAQNLNGVADANDFSLFHWNNISFTR